MGAVRLFLNRFDTGLKTKQRQKINPDAAGTTIGIKLRPGLLSALIFTLIPVSLL